MLLLTNILAELWVINHVLPVNGRHLLFTTRPDIGQYFHAVACSTAPDPPTTGFSVGPMGSGVRCPVSGAPWWSTVPGYVTAATTKRQRPLQLIPRPF